MAKNGKLNKWRCLIKRWNSSSRITRASSSSPDVGAASARSTQDDTWHGCQDDIPAGFHPVYVGKSRRRYLVRSFLVEHPFFQNLAERPPSTAPPW
ncbi:hypothetical protein HPP92_027605 [Vanilla planifolia]|uniref:Uncharacterized protein n=1 Tax=Vanilla planifolia TaxID=51239 RepID=A0A835U5U0_VANPL|nr:hypothetical protein HPP92_027605 [Vanilla planifolia]KAG0448960.1 hypothetical protein HPP92_027602 [Vanilla planifolia]